MEPRISAEASSKRANERTASPNLYNPVSLNHNPKIFAIPMVNEEVEASGHQQGDDPKPVERPRTALCPSTERARSARGRVPCVWNFLGAKPPSEPTGLSRHGELKGASASQRQRRASEAGKKSSLVEFSGARSG
ncbi:MAG: hypothetical protein AUK47_14350 [Deltaproteobacteria bacterium CG2_30_63_29]|nr:MAG: hypothetical protein AUK47_14350 [Deltaproteobacteria bacterium CG2_30_63_29]PJB45215.1 MAG: hypothetical protein CO108_07670 [Deltaproteobacteria bacterium CG_4_9_14_3_um_filter_63_12]